MSSREREDAGDPWPRRSERRERKGELVEVLREEKEGGGGGGETEDGRLFGRERQQGS